MKPYIYSARVTLYACRAVAAVVVVLLAGFPMLIGCYHENFRPLLSKERFTLISAFYACVPAVLIALWNMDRLLRNILKAQLFITKNVSYIRGIRWCCLAVSLICLAATFGFPALLLIAMIMAFLCLSVTVLGQVMKAGVEIREENDLTV